MSGVSNEKLKELEKELPLRWRQQGTASQYGVNMIPYIDARDASSLLNEVCGSANWKKEMFMCGERLICRVWINTEENGWIFKDGNGDNGLIMTEIFKRKVATCDPAKLFKLEDEYSRMEKGGDSDSFKRACVNWGVNVSAYNTDIVNVKTKEYKGKYYPINDNGQFLKGQALNDYCNSKIK